MEFARVQNRGRRNRRVRCIRWIFHLQWRGAHFVLLWKHRSEEECRCECRLRSIDRIVFVQIDSIR